jgi:hypothetical protein
MAVMEALAQNVVDHPLLYRAVDMVRNHSTVAPPNRGAEYGGSEPFPFSENISFEIRIFTLLSVWVLTHFRFSVSMETTT